jgi:hypothetical protein
VAGYATSAATEPQDSATLTLGYKYSGIVWITESCDDLMPLLCAALHWKGIQCRGRQQVRVGRARCRHVHDGNRAMLACYKKAGSSVLWESVPRRTFAQRHSATISFGNN